MDPASSAIVATFCTNSELARLVRGLGTDFYPYAVALEERSELDSTYISGLVERDLTLLFALVPREHRQRLEVCFGLASHDPEKGSDDGGLVADCNQEAVRTTPPSLAVVSDNEDLSGAGSPSDELFLDLDRSSDDGALLEQHGRNMKCCMCAAIYLRMGEWGGVFIPWRALTSTTITFLLAAKVPAASK